MGFDEESGGALDWESVDAACDSPSAFLVDDAEAGSRGVRQRDDLGLAAVELRHQEQVGFRRIDHSRKPSRIRKRSSTRATESIDGDLPVNRPRDPALPEQGRQQVQPSSVGAAVKVAQNSRRKTGPLGRAGLELAWSSRRAAPVARGERRRSRPAGMSRKRIRFRVGRACDSCEPR